MPLLQTQMVEDMEGEMNMKELREAVDTFISFTDDLDTITASPRKYVTHQITVCNEFMDDMNKIRRLCEKVLEGEYVKCPSVEEIFNIVDKYGDPYTDSEARNIATAFRDMMKGQSHER